MRPVQAEFGKIAKVSVALFLAVFIPMLYLQGAQLPVIANAVRQSGSVITIIAGFWVFYEKWGWRHPILRFGGWLCAQPDLNGRWEGTICRFRGDSPHPIVIEVRQSLNSLSFQTFTRRSTGRSTSASILQAEDGSFFVTALWQTTGRRLDDPGAEDTFYGSSLWQLSLMKQDKRIRDIYFTRREPGTKGEMNLVWKSAKCLGRFQE